MFKDYDLLARLGWFAQRGAVPGAMRTLGIALPPK